jgi:hypothetical protein
VTTRHKTKAADDNEAKKDDEVDCVQPPLLDFTSKWSMTIPSIHDKSVDLDTCTRWPVPVDNSINDENNTI